MRKVIILILLYVGAFVLINNSIPQQASMPPKIEKFDVALLQTKKDLAIAGRKIYFGKGKCALCHSIEPSKLARCPILSGIGAKLSKEFLIKSLIEPQSYVYMDYSVSPPKPFPAQMPAINKPPIGLNMQEILVVVAFLQSIGGEITVEPAELFAEKSSFERVERNEG